MKTRLALAATAALALAVPSAAGAQYAAMTGDLNAPIFKTEFALVPEDVNGTQDYYTRVGGVPKLLTHGTGKDASPHLFRASGDGSVAFFRTTDALVAQDGDDTADVYVRRPSGIALVAPQATTKVDVVDASADGALAYLDTKAALLPSDTDEYGDIYVYDTASGVIGLLTPGTTEPVSFHDGSDNGIAIFSTTEKIKAGDTDSTRDIYWAGSGQYGLFTNGDGAHPVFFHAADMATGHVLYSSEEQLRPEDTDDKLDIYQASAGGFLELRTPSSNQPAQNVEFIAAAKGFGRLIFTTHEKLLPGDTDAAEDYYAKDGANLTLITPGTTTEISYEDVSDDAEVMLFSTKDKLAPTDTDDRMDMYRTGDGGLDHVSKTNGPHDEFQGALSFNGVLTAFQTTEKHSDGDTDPLTDVYVRVKSTLQLASPRTEAAGGSQDHVSVVEFLGTSELIMETKERLRSEDRNEVSDLFAFKPFEVTMVTHDASAPDTLAAAPAKVATGEAIVVTVAATEKATLECRVDGGEWVACATGWNPGALAAGAHAIEARATDVARNVDASPAKVDVMVGTPTVTEEKPPVVEKPPVLPVPDTLAPALSAARVLVKRRIPKLTFSLSEAATVKVTVERRSGGRWKALRGKAVSGASGVNRATLSKLPRRGTFRVTLVATDAAGNASARLVLRPKRR